MDPFQHPEPTNDSGDSTQNVHSETIESSLLNPHNSRKDKSTPTSTILDKGSLLNSDFTPGNVHSTTIDSTPLNPYDNKDLSTPTDTNLDEDSPLNSDDPIPENVHSTTMESIPLNPYDSSKDLSTPADINLDDNSLIYDFQRESRDPCDIHHHQFIGDIYYRDGIEVYQFPHTLNNDSALNPDSNTDGESLPEFSKEPANPSFTENLRDSKVELSSDVTHCQPERSSNSKDDNFLTKVHRKTDQPWIDNGINLKEDLPRQTSDSPDSSADSSITSQDSADTLKNRKLNIST